ncbi:TIGR04282 family arsenosugar biosynthesis glycosyltransferase [Flavobacterium tegetincola]|uniref:TIGR04282 family arsenosugar biosynthesis glycosyltransferase n=1 Tax=Flavobacterium tegetincola TaxID=150172 RepID=UPI0003FE2B51|nr:TIGR04282 family arsenosugar biosynthesis glycosyltransferase [Flavobacterium tegetincola]
MQNKKALLLFTKNPELGKCKTRLAKTIGDVKALEIYIKLLEHTREIVIPVDVDKFVFYSENIEREDDWDNAVFQKRVQNGDDLGQKMQNAFRELFQLKYDSVCIIGSDCYELNSETINQSFIELESKDVVIGPTNDGGYYLLGMKKLHAALFENKNWSTETVYSDTIADFEQFGLSYSNLVKLTDIDEEKDVPKHWR